MLTTDAETILPTAKFQSAASPQVCILLLPFTAGPLRTKCFILEYVENCRSVTPAVNVKATRGHFLDPTTSLFSLQIREVTKIQISVCMSLLQVSQTFEK